MKQHPNFFHFIKNTFKAANLHFLGKQSAIKGKLFNNLAAVFLVSRFIVIKGATKVVK